MDQGMSATQLDEKLALRAFKSANFDWARQLQSVWRDAPYHVDDLHKQLLDDLFEDFIDSSREQTSSPLGRVVVGPAGAGKTHLVGQLRKRAWENNAWFVLLDIVGIKDFWITAALCFLTSLQQSMPDGRSQSQTVLSRIIQKFGQDKADREAILQWHSRPGRTHLDAVEVIIGLLRRRYPADALAHADIVRAMLLLDSRDLNYASLAHSWLQGFEVDAQKQAELGFSRAQPNPTQIVRGLSWLMSLTGPTIVAVDQIDAIVSASSLQAGMSPSETDDTQKKAQSIIQLLAGGLMDLKDVAARSMTVLTSLEVTWEALLKWAPASALGRFEKPQLLEPPSSSAQVEGLITGRLTPAYAERGFVPPYATWPFTVTSIEVARDLLPRSILMRCDDHRRLCIAEGRVLESLALDAVATTPVTVATASSLDTEFDELKKQARLAELQDHPDESHLRDLLTDVLGIYIKEVGVPEDVDAFVQGDPDIKRPSLHARLTFCFRSEGDREQHYCFRVLGHANAIAFQARLRAAMTASGIDRALPFRHLSILRFGPVPSGQKTGMLSRSFEEAGGVFIAPSEDDLRTFAAVSELRRQDSGEFVTWLRARRPLSKTMTFNACGLVPPPVGAGTEQGPSRSVDAQPSTQPARKEERPPAPTPPVIENTPAPPPHGDGVADAIPVGRRLNHGTEGESESLAIRLLHRHSAILAGSGSGKTVLLRRIVEEAALSGIPAIVLDTNNDLARLGDRWTPEPTQWTQAERAKANRYFENVEVVVWTPGVNQGNPLTLSLLPDFGALDDPDEKNQAVAMAHATLVPFIGASGASGKLKEGVLADALRYFAGMRSNSLTKLTDLLSDLPDGVSEIGNASALGEKIADQLRAAIAVNPLLQAKGQSLDPKVLFEGPNRRTRISVINFAGVPTDQGRQAFVNQLQMNLFTWIKQNPSERGRLFVLDEAQNFAPAQTTTPCKASTIALAAQARKYGLGMIFATQAPKGIDSKIVSNCTTHFYGKMNAPATIQAVRELMSAKGSAPNDIGKLSAGEFYFSTEGQSRPTKIKTPLCFSFHPQNPLGSEEIITRARASIGPGDVVRPGHQS